MAAKAAELVSPALLRGSARMGEGCRPPLYAPLPLCSAGGLAVVNSLPHHR